MYSIENAGPDGAVIACMRFAYSIGKKVLRMAKSWAMSAVILATLGASLNAAETVYVKDVIPLPVRVATIHGDGARLDGALIENWEKIETYVSWRVKLGAGELGVVVRQASGSGSVGNSYQVEIAEHKLSGTVKDTGGWRLVQDVPVGSIRLPKPGEYQVTLRPLKKKGHSVMNLAGITLRGPAASGAELIISTELRRGEFYAKKHHEPQPLPSFDAIKGNLPEPVMDGHADWLPMYWKCWQLAFAHLKKPASSSPLVSNWLDEAFSSNLFQWDTCFMMMFARYGHTEFPFIQSLDNFYCLQRNSGYICREYTEDTGREIKFGHKGGFGDPNGWVNTINPPIFAWAECESYKLTGDKSRLAAVLPVLEKYLEFLNRDGDPEASPDKWQEQGRRSVGTPHQLYWNTSLGSGMDDIPKPTKKGSGWVDMSCQMVMQYRQLALICREIGQQEKAAKFEEEAKLIGERINKWCWNREDGFYYDVLADGTQFKKKTLCGFWPMVAGIASPEQVRKMVAHLKDEKEFWRPFVFPTLAADEKEYNFATGGYWRGAVWAPTNYAVIKGLEACGEEALATEATVKYLTGMNTVFQKTGTVYENYKPEKIEPSSGKGDFVGWTGCGPIVLLIENVLGFRADGPGNRLDWRLVRGDRHGIRKLSFGQVTTDVIYDGKGQVSVTTNKPYKLVINGQAYAVPAGVSSYSVKPLSAK